MLIIDNNQFEILEDVFKFIFDLKSIEVTPNTGKYYNEVAMLIGMSQGGVRNSLFKKDEHTISEMTLNHFLKKFDEIKAKISQTEKEPEVQIQAERLRNWVTAIRNSNTKNVQNTFQKVNSENSEEIKLPKNFLNKFENSIWYCYERHENAIGKKKVNFESFTRDTCNVIIETGEEGIDPWFGEAMFNEKEDALIIVSKNSYSGKDYTHYLISVDRRKKDLELCIGHMSYKHWKNLNIVTKAILLIRENNSNKQNSKKGLFTLNSKEIEEPIKTLFQDRRLNRLSSPHSIEVYSLKTLQDWLDHNKPKPRFTHSPLLGNYIIYSKEKPADRKYIKNELTISEKDGKLFVRFIHKINPNEPKLWEGFGYLNFESHVLVCILDDSATNVIFNDNDRITILLINLPDGAIKKIDTLVGIATGHRDQNRGSVSRLIVLLKLKDGNLSKNYNLKDLNDFFFYFKNRSRVRPPFTNKIPSIYEFSHLKKVMDDFKSKFGDDIQ